MRNVVTKTLLSAVPVLCAVLLVADEAPRVKLQDDCDPTTFNAAVGPGTCDRENGGDTTFANFIAQVTKLKKAPEWRFDPSSGDASAGSRVRLENDGGETHSFTRVDQFGGGLVPVLNILSGNPVVAPECASPNVFATFVNSGQEVRGPKLDPSDRGKTVKFQCCIHPWMRAEITVR